MWPLLHVTTSPIILPLQTFVSEAAHAHADADDDDDDYGTACYNFLHHTPRSNIFLNLLCALPLHSPTIPKKNLKGHN